MLLRNAAVLAGPELDHIPCADVRINGGLFETVAQGLRPEPGEGCADCSGLLLVPGFVNAHTHIGDSVAKDAVSGDTEARIHPVYGAKKKILDGTPGHNIADFMRATCRLMISNGTTTFADFREGGLGGVRLAREALRGVPIRAVILGRLERYEDPGSRDLLTAPQREELGGLVDACDGLGISGANENGGPALQEYSETGKLVAIHAAETAHSTAESARITGRSEVSRALEARPDFLVHMTHASKKDLDAASAAGAIVACPRANAALGGGVPDIASMMRSCSVALGTDNVMVNSPDMLREMDFAWKASSGLGRRVGARQILQMATVNGARALGINAGAISEGMAADCILFERDSLELAPMHDPHAAIVGRATGQSIRAVLFGGEVAHGKI